MGKKVSKLQKHTLNIKFETKTLQKTKSCKNTQNILLHLFIFCLLDFTFKLQNATERQPGEYVAKSRFDKGLALWI